ncbi:hypothetical protein CEXT_328911 [Caerostris extrusa]|uniref:Uncharacterized protein n=1 Tax=Caerostris extrusa TaxID=172846 RepID=A0AAV4U293_CAEEX|nr:hypothetical protein CEXT_328911 [Caerostris extrusa]
MPTLLTPKKVSVEKNQRTLKSRTPRRNKASEKATGGRKKDFWLVMDMQCDFQLSRSEDTCFDWRSLHIYRLLKCILARLGIQRLDQG